MNKTKISDELLPPVDGADRKEMKNLYTWTLEEAVQAQRQWTGKHRGPLYQWLGAQELLELYKLYKAGHKEAIIEAFFSCSINSLPLPEWLEMAFLRAYREVRCYRAKSWDDVFEQPHPKNMKIGAKKDEREKGVEVYSRVREMRDKDSTTAIDRGLFNDIGGELGLSGSLAEKYYYNFKNKFNR